MPDYQNIQGALMIYTDEELLLKMAGDNREAFTVLYRRYWEQLFVTAAKTLRGKEEAADVVQDVFISFWNRRKELNIKGSIPAYLHTSIRYKCIHYIEKNITRRDYLLQLADVEVSNPSGNAEINLQLKEIQQIISDTVAKMPAKMQEAYKLSRHEHLSYKQIGEYMGISVETVKKHIQHALHLIRTNLPPDTFIFVMLVLIAEAGKPY